MLAKCDNCKVIFANRNSWAGLCGICHKKIKGWMYGCEFNTSQITTATFHHKFCNEYHCYSYNSINYDKTYRPESLATIAFGTVEHNRLQLNSKELQHLYKRMELLYQWRVVSEYLNKECPKRSQK